MASGLEETRMHPLLNIAVSAARAAGKVIIRQINNVQDLSVNEKSRNDFVTEVDRQAEAVIIDVIHKYYPGHGILAEESGRSGSNSDENIWIIDPLDGTTNYLHGFPQYAVSIALQNKGVLKQGVIYDPLRDELFTASRGHGAYLNERRIRVSKQKHLQGALLGTGFPFREGARTGQYLETLKVFFAVTAGIRRAGAAALDLAYVACGRLDGFWEIGLKPWDMAAGVLLIEESGGLVSDFTGGDSFLATGAIIAANPDIHKEILTSFSHLQFD
jgi:myo-inositol-1(or 4)-monophosphatase